MGVASGGGRVGLALWALLAGACGGGTGPAGDAAADGARADVGPSSDRPADAGVDRPDAPEADRPADLPGDVAPDGGADRPPDGPLPRPASFLLTPESWDFGTVARGMTGTKMFELENTGELNSGTPSITLVGGDGETFRIVDNACETALEPDTSCAITVNFSPSTAGRQAVLLEAEASPGGRVSTQLAGTGGP